MNVSACDCEHPDCEAPAYNAIGGFWHCEAHADWAVEMADAVSMADDVEMETAQAELEHDAACRCEADAGDRT